MTGMDAEKPHLIERDGELVPASTAEIAPLARNHGWHDGIAWFEDCEACQQARAEGRYPHWFPEGGSR